MNQNLPSNKKNKYKDRQLKHLGIMAVNPTDSNSSQNLNTKPIEPIMKTEPFTPTKFNVLDVFSQTFITAKTERDINDILEQYYGFDASEPRTILTLKKIMGNPGLALELVAHYVNENTSLKDDEKRKHSRTYTTLSLRIRKVAIHWMVISELVRICLIRNFGLTVKMTSIQHFINRKEITLKLSDNPNDQFAVTVSSTFKLLNDCLNYIENTIKELKPGILSIYRCNFEINLGNLPFNELIESIAPPGFQGVEPDYYYLMRWLLEPPAQERFSESPTAYDMWLNYKKECEFLFRFLSSNVIKPSLTELIESPSHYINIPYVKFAGNEVLSKTTLGKTFNAFNRILPKLWIIVLKFKMREHTLLTEPNNKDITSTSK